MTRFPQNPARPQWLSLSRAAFATFASRADIARRGPAVAVAADLWRDHANVQTLLKAAENPGSTGDHAGLVATSTREFLAALPTSAGARLMADAVLVPMGTDSTLKIPFDNSALDAGASWAEENSPIAVSQGVSGAITLGPVKKLGLILVASRSLARQPGAEAIFRFMLESRAAFAFDAALFSTDAATDAAAAGLLHGRTPVTGYGGGDELAMREDVNALTQAVGDAGGTGALAFVMGAARAARLQMLMPAFPWPILASRAIAVDRCIALDPSQLVIGTGGGIDIETTTSALIHMNTEALEIVSATGPTVADPVREVWQTDAIATRLLVDLAFSARPGTVQFATGCSW